MYNSFGVMDRQYSTDIAADTAQNTLQNTLQNTGGNTADAACAVDARAIESLCHKDRRFLRKAELVRAFGKAVRNDLLIHPWKLFFLVAPIAPPLSGMLTVMLTALHFQLGLTAHARTQKAIIKDGFSRPVDGGVYAPFVKAAPTNLCAQAQPAALDRWAVTTHLYYQGMNELYGMSIHYCQSLRRVFGVKAGLRYMERQQTRVQGKMALNLEKHTNTAPCCSTPQP